MQAENTAIKILAITALLLLGVLVLLPAPSDAQVSLKDGDYLVTAYPTAGGNDAIYVADTRTGAFAVFTYDPGAKALLPRAARPIADAFMVR